MDILNKNIFTSSGYTVECISGNPPGQVHLKFTPNPVYAFLKKEEERILWGLQQDKSGWVITPEGVTSGIMKLFPNHDLQNTYMFNLYLKQSSIIRPIYTSYFKEWNNRMYKINRKDCFHTLKKSFAEANFVGESILFHGIYANIEFFGYDQDYIEDDEYMNYFFFAPLSVQQFLFKHHPQRTVSSSVIGMTDYTLKWLLCFSNETEIFESELPEKIEQIMKREISWIQKVVNCYADEIIRTAYRMIFNQELDSVEKMQFQLSILSDNASIYPLDFHFLDPGLWHLSVFQSYQQSKYIHEDGSFSIQWKFDIHSAKVHQAISDSIIYYCIKQYIETQINPRNMPSAYSFFIPCHIEQNMLCPIKTFCCP